MKIGLYSPFRKLRLSSAFLVAACSASLTTGLVVTSSANAEACPNEQLRQENGSLSLPDCRAYEMVSPLEKSDAGVLGIDSASEGGVVQAAADGSSITYVSLGSFEDPQGAPLGSQYLSTRGSAEWSTQNITTPEISDTYANAGYGTQYEAFSSDLTRRLMINGLGYRPVETPPLAPGAPPGYQNFYLNEESSGAFQALLTSMPTETPTTFVMELTGATPDLKHVVIATNAALTTGMLDTGELNRNLYEWMNGQFEPINVLPDGTPVPGAQVGSTSTSFESRSVSDDGSRVFWVVLPGGAYEPSLYVRENGTETIQVDASQGPDKSGEGIFRTASSDGSKAFFTDRRRLTKDSTANKETAEGEDLYEFNVNSGQLSDLTVDENISDPNGASVQGVLGASEDGSLVYFVAKGMLAGANDEGHLPVSGGFNLYVHDGEGHTLFVATLSPDDERSVAEEEGGVTLAQDWNNSEGARTTRVTPDGRHLIFMSDASLTGYDNIDASTEHPDQEVYSYTYNGAGAGHLICISCNPNGTRPIGASRIPGGTDFGSGGAGEAVYQSRVLSEDGSRVFFDSRDALVPADTNGEQDVYEYESGLPHLISGGTSGEESSFVDASATGGDAFFITSQALVTQDTDTLVDLYDARVSGGLPPPPTPAPPCGGEGCLPPPSAQPVFSSGASTTFTGGGNLGAPLGKQVVKPRKHKHKRKPKPHTKKAKHLKAKRATKGGKQTTKAGKQ